MATDNDRRRRAGKRGNGEGSVYQRRDGTWAASLMVGRKANGTPDRRTVYGKTRAEAVKKLDELRQRNAAGLIVEATGLTVQAFIDQWLRDSVALNGRAATCQTYEIIARRHILPRIGRVKLAALRPAHVQAVYAAMTGAGYAASTVRVAHALLHRAFEQAVAWGYLARNPADATDPPRVRQREMHALSREQAQRLVEVADAAGDRWVALWRLLLDSGARIGEALALTWADLDLDGGAMSIQRTLTGVMADGAPVRTEPKTKRSARTVTLMPATLSALRAHRARQNAERLACGPDYAGHDLVFCTQVGTARRHPVYVHYLRTALKRAELPRVRTHDLRHTAATLMLEAGVNPRVVADRLGHSQVSITLDRYSHVTPSMEADAAARVARVMGWDR